MRILSLQYPTLDGAPFVGAFQAWLADTPAWTAWGLDQAQVQRLQRGTWYLRLKRVVDVVLAAWLLVLLLPVLVVIALAVKLSSPGPVLYLQPRIGRGGQPFDMLKFRTMGPDRRHHAIGPPPGLVERRRYHKTRDAGRDPRVTRVGRILRRTSLDELPQLWNVLVGEMSLIGPRPEMPYLVERYQPWQHARHLVRPGITGWWQVNRSDHWLEGRLMHEATELDIYYVRHQSLRLDLEILLRTFGAVVRGSGAY
jgi:lipopolysaccharide/colanic/teichoic acid biosynthesis glycosyltransferase